MNQFDDEGNPLVSDETKLAIENAEENITVIEAGAMEKSDTVVTSEQKDEEIQLLKNEIEKLKDLIDTKDEINVISQGKISSLEMDVENYKVKMEKYHKIVTKISEENNRLKNVIKENSTKEIGDKYKKAVSEIKAKNKELDEAKKNLKRLEDKLQNEVNIRAKAEADVVRLTKFTNHLQEALDKSKNASGNKKQDKVNKKCTNLEKDGTCSFGEDCKYIHPSSDCQYYIQLGNCQLGKECKENHNKKEREIFVNKNENKDQREKMDCFYWLKGDCKLSGGSHCSRGLHNLEKFGAKKKQEGSFLVQGPSEGFRNNQIATPVSQHLTGQAQHTQLFTLGVSVYLHRWVVYGPGK